MNEIELKEIVFIDQSNFTCSLEQVCLYQERTISYAVGIELPPASPDIGEIFEECCYVHYVLADRDSSEDYKNDFSSVYHQRQLPNEAVNFFLLHLDTGNEFELKDTTYGDFFALGSLDENLNFAGVRVDWRKVLLQIGEGSYKIVKRQNLAGIDFESEGFVYTLREFSSARANKTIRIDSSFNGTIEKTGVSFKGLNWKQSIRLPGFFGRRQSQFEEDTLVNRRFRLEQVSIKQTNEYQMQTNLIPSCITEEVLDFMLLADNLEVTDYNLNNHSYNFVKFGVKVSNNEGTDYGVFTRKARLNLVFTDRVENNIKRNFK